MCIDRAGEDGVSMDLGADAARRKTPHWDGGLTVPDYSARIIGRDIRTAWNTKGGHRT